MRKILVNTLWYLGCAFGVVVLCGTRIAIFFGSLFGSDPDPNDYNHPSGKGY